jgi:DNA-binding transcriptional LysR family regulator
MKQEFYEIKSQSRNRLRIGMSPWHASLLSTTLLPELLLQNPLLQLEIFEQPHSALCMMAAKGDLDFCIVNAPGKFDDVSFEIMIYERILVAINKSCPELRHLNARQSANAYNLKAIDLSLIKEEVFLLPTKDTTLAPVIENYLHTNSIRLLRTAGISNRLTALEMVNSGVGVALFRNPLFA